MAALILSIIKQTCTNLNQVNCVGIQFLSTKPSPQPSGRVLASRAGGSAFNPQSRTASYQRRYNNGTSSSLVWHSTLKRKILALSQELRQENKCYGLNLGQKILQSRQKSNAKNKKTFFFLHRLKRKPTNTAIKKRNTNT